jgi:hypothetical protein
MSAILDSRTLAFDQWRKDALAIFHAVMLGDPLAHTFKTNGRECSSLCGRKTDMANLSKVDHKRTNDVCAVCLPNHQPAPMKDLKLARKPKTKFYVETLDDLTVVFTEGGDEVTHASAPDEAIQRAIASLPAEELPALFITDKLKLRDLSQASSKICQDLYALAVEGSLAMTTDHAAVDRAKEKWAKPKPQPSVKRMASTPKPYGRVAELLRELQTSTVVVDSHFMTTKRTAKLLVDLEAPEDLVIAWVLTGFGDRRRGVLLNQHSEEITEICESLCVWRTRAPVAETPYTKTVRRVTALEAIQHRLRVGKPLVPRDDLRFRVCVDANGWTLPKELHAIDKNLIAAFNDLEPQLPP